MPLPAFLPTTPAEMRARGWKEADVVFVTGDAYVDHPSFAMAILGRVLESHGFKVAILPQPDWRSADAWRALGRPRLFYAVSAGNMDSMINHYTANRKRRNDDAYSPGGRAGCRPDRATAVYAQRCREAVPGVPVVIGGIEASLRRIAHFDYWSETVRPSMLVPSKADLLAFGKGEETIVAVAERLRAGESVRDLRDLKENLNFYYLRRSEKEIYPRLWQMVSGSIHKGETAYQTAFREIGEETNLRPIKIWVVPNVNSFYSPEKNYISLLPVFAVKVNPNSKVRISDEHAEYKWVRKEKAKKIEGEIFLDSEFVAKQMNHEYKVKEKNCRRYF